MEETTYEGEAFLIRARDDGEDNFVFDERTIRIVTAEEGFFGGEDNPQNENLDVTLFDLDTSQSFPGDAIESGTVSITYNQGGGRVTTVFAFADISETDGYLVRVSGPEPEGFGVGTDIEDYLVARAGEVSFNPLGFGFNDFITFDSIAGLMEVGGGPAPNPNPDPDPQPTPDPIEVLDPALVYVGDFLFFDEDADTVELRPVQVTTRIDGFTIGEEDLFGEVQIVDRRTNEDIDIEETEVFRIDFSNGGSAFYVDVEIDDSDDQYSAYVRGMQIPNPSGVVDAEDFFVASGVSNDVNVSNNPASQFAFGQTIAFDEIGDLTLVGDVATQEEVIEIALLYESGLGRQAAFEGLNFWVDRFEGGRTKFEIAQSFLVSTEFQNAVGDWQALTNEEFIDGLANNVLGRSLAESGQMFWEGRLEDGASRAQTLFAFATVPENRAQSPAVETIDEVSLGVWDFMG